MLLRGENGGSVFEGVKVLVAVSNYPKVV